MKTHPPVDRLMQCAQQCSMGAYIQQSPEEENGMRVVTTTSSQSNDNSNCHIQIKPLVILDLNGILCHRIRKSKEDRSSTTDYRPIDAHVAGTPVIAPKRKTVYALLEQLKIPAAHFLFVWGQDQCLVTNNDDNDKNGTIPLFQKDLQKVWKQYPLWDRNNTLLMDDSREKIIASQEEMAMHPIPLNGRRGASTPHLNTNNDYDDQHVCQEQDLFLQQFVQHWQQHALLQEYAKTDDTSWSATTTVTTKWQSECLREYSRPTMQWGGSLASSSCNE